jgi:winged helix-turn helix protein
MIRPDFEKWKQSPQEILKLSLEAAHKRTRERFQALYMIGTGQANASQWSQQIGRQDVTVLNWVHIYNAQGPAGLRDRHSGGRPPLLSQARKPK